MCALFSKFMSLVRVAKVIVLSILFLCAQSVRSQVTVYQNGAQPEGVDAQEGVEYGDEINLVGDARILTKIRFEYAGDFVPQGDEMVCLRIYANDGPYWKGNTDYATPGSLLWESGFFPIEPGHAVKEVLIPSIRVQEHFTWTVEFKGLTMQTGITTSDPNVTNDFAGLAFYGNAEIGSSFNDFWDRLTTGWAPVRVQAVPHNNFGAAVTAVSEAVIPKLTITPYRTNLVLVTWPRSASDFKLQYRTRMSGNWFNVGGPPPAIVGNKYNRVLDLSMGTMFLRLTQVALVAPTLTITNEGRFVRVTWPGASTGFVLQSKESPGSAFWRDEYTPGAAVSNRFDVVLARDSVEKVFRLRQETKAVSLEIAQDGTNVTVRWPALMRGYALQSKPAIGPAFWTLEARPTNAVGNYYEVVRPMVAGENRVFRLTQ